MTDNATVVMEDLKILVVTNMKRLPEKSKFADLVLFAANEG